MICTLPQKGCTCQLQEELLQEEDLGKVVGGDIDGCLDDEAGEIIHASQDVGVAVIVI